VSERRSFNYAIVRLVPHPEREEFLNVGVILCCQASDFLAAEFSLDLARLNAFAPGLDLEEVKAHLEAIRRICAGGDDAGEIGRLPRRARFDWLIAPRSTIIQTSASHTGLCDDPKVALDQLVKTMVKAPSAQS
jgi:hypothetical protein